MSTAYQLFIRRSAELSPKTRTRVAKKIRGLGDEPRPPGCKKLSGEDRAWRIRVGDYRVVYEINDT